MENQTTTIQQPQPDELIQLIHEATRAQASVEIRITIHPEQSQQTGEPQLALGDIKDA